MKALRLQWAVLAVALSLGAGFGSYALSAQSVAAPAQLAHDASTDPVRISPEEAALHLIAKVDPVYPPVAKLARIEGSVRIEILVNPDGTVRQAVQSSGHPILVKAAIAAVTQYKYQPFTKDGKAEAAIFWVQIDFALAVYKPPSVPFPNISDYGSIVITMDTGYFRLTITGDGVVDYEGRSYVVIEGKHRARIALAEFKSLVAAFQAADFFSLDDDCSHHASDAATTSMSIQIGAQTKKVDVDVDVPASLQTLRDSISKLSHAAQWVDGNSETVPGLLREGGDTRQTREVLSQALTAAATFSSTEVVDELVRAGADVQTPDREGRTALMLAAERGLPDMVRILLKAGADAKTKDKNRRTALMFAGVSGNATVLEQLLPSGLINARSKWGTTALMAAAAAGNPDLVIRLLQKGARVNDRDDKGVTALLAGSIGDLDSLWNATIDSALSTKVPDEVVHRDAVVRLLLEAGAEINARNKDGESALFSLEEDAVRELIAHKIDLETRDQYGETALIETVAPEIAKQLVAAGADLNAHDPKGRTALMEAANNNDFEKIRVLTASPKLKINLRDHKGMTALMIAAADASPDCVKALLAAHPDLNIRYKSGETALQFAEAGAKNAREGYKVEGYTKAAKLLREAGAQN